MTNEYKAALQQADIARGAEQYPGVGRGTPHQRASGIHELARHFIDRDTTPMPAHLRHYP